MHIYCILGGNMFHLEKYAFPVVCISYALYYYIYLAVGFVYSISTFLQLYVL